MSQYAGTEGQCDTLGIARKWSRDGQLNRGRPDPHLLAYVSHAWTPPNLVPPCAGLGAG